MTVLPGLEVLMRDPSPVAGRRWALLANHAAVTIGLEPARSALTRAAGAPALLFAPEHGLEGVAQDMEGVVDGVDPLTGVSVRSLYGDDATTLAPNPGDLEGLDVVVVVEEPIRTHQRRRLRVGALPGLATLHEALLERGKRRDAPAVRPGGAACRQDASGRAA